MIIILHNLYLCSNHCNSRIFVTMRFLCIDYHQSDSCCVIIWQCAIRQPSERKIPLSPSAHLGTRDECDKKWWNSYAASSTTVARKNSVLLSLEMTTTGSRGVSSSSSLLPDAVFVGSSIPGATKAAAPSAVSANLATEYPLRDLSQKPLEKLLHLSCTFSSSLSAMSSGINPSSSISTMHKIVTMHFFDST